MDYSLTLEYSRGQYTRAEPPPLLQTVHYSNNRFTTAVTSHLNTLGIVYMYTLPPMASKDLQLMPMVFTEAMYLLLVEL